MSRIFFKTDRHPGDSLGISTFMAVAFFIVILAFISGCASPPPAIDRPAAPRETLTKNPAAPADESKRTAARIEAPYSEYAEALMEKNSGNIQEASRLISLALEKDPDSIYLQIEAAQLWIMQKEVEKSFELIQKILAKDPLHIDALSMFAEIQRRKKEFESAKNACLKIIELDPEQENIHLLLSQIFVEEKNLPAALKTLEAMAKILPESYSAHYLMGALYIESKKAAPAERAFKRALELEPNSPGPMLELLKIYETQKRDDEALAIYQRMLEKDPDDLITLIKLGLNLHKKGKTDESEKIFQEMGENSDENPQIVGIVLQVYVHTKKFDDALIILKAMEATAPDNGDIHHALGLVYDAKGDLEAAAARFKRVKKGDGFYKGAVANVAFLYQEMGKLDQGIEYLEQALSETTDDPDFFLYLASFYEQSKKFEKAKKALLRGLEAGPENMDLYFRLGVVHDKTGQKEKSIAAMKEAVRLAPKNPSVLNYLGYTYVELGTHLDEAEDLIRRALKEKPYDGHITDSLGWLYFKKGLFEQALKTLKKANDLSANEPVILEHIGDAHLKLNDKKNALEFYKRSLKNHGPEKDMTTIEKKINDLL